MYPQLHLSQKFSLFNLTGKLILIKTLTSIKEKILDSKQKPIL